MHVIYFYYYIDPDQAFTSKKKPLSYDLHHFCFYIFLLNYWFITVYNNLRHYITIKSFTLITDGIMCCINILRSSIITPSSQSRKNELFTISESFIIVTAQRWLNGFDIKKRQKQFHIILFLSLFLYVT